MLTSLAYILLLGLLLSAVFRALRLPGLLGMLIAGVVLGPYGMDLLDASLLSISADLRQLALIIILMRAGLALDLDDLRRVGRPAVLMCFVPACFEIAGMVLIAPALLGVSLLDAAIMGAVIAAVSPAVVVPRMLRLMEEGYGTARGIPQLIMAGASVDDVFVIVLFTAFTGLAGGMAVTAAGLLRIPASIALGILVGALLGLALAGFYRRVRLRDSEKVMLQLGLSFLLVAAERALEGVVPFSGLLAVMAMGVALRRRRGEVACRLSAKLSKLWVAAEVLLFALVGATVDISFAQDAGAMSVLVILGALAFRMAGVFICLLRTPLATRERLFCMIAYCPKATVQAAIGSLPLAMGLPCGQIVLTAAVLSILITAPLGAIGIDRSYRALLTKDA